MLSSLLSSGFGTSTTSLHGSVSGRNTPAKLVKAPQLMDIPTFEPAISRNNSNRSMHSTNEPDIRTNPWRDEERPSNPLVKLEETFTGYVAALQSRKGNVVGKALRQREGADELAINAIYNAFIENPFDQRAASEVTVDVLFVAFEKFLRMAWKDQMGFVVPLQTLNALQDRALRAFRGEFAEYVRGALSEMAPQNRRAFIAVIKLLADILDGCGNDGDRGMVTVAFAELLIVEGDPHEYINLLDRMVDEHERLFEDIGPGAVAGYDSAYGSINGRSNFSATGSLTSNTSSLRKRFTETLLRQNSSKDSDRPSVWRTLSKNSSRSMIQTESSNPSSLSKGSINRSQSIESPHRRPASRDRPTVLGAFDERPSSSHGLGSRLSTIGGSPPNERREDEKSHKKKRRSSLSDLKSMMAKTTLGSASPFACSPSGAMAFSSPKSTSPRATSPRTPVPTKIPVLGGMMNRGRGATTSAGSPLPKPKEDVASSANQSSSRTAASLRERPINISSTPDVLHVKDLWATNSTPTNTAAKTHSKSISLSSNIPTLHGHPAPSPGGTIRITSPTKPGPQKLRLQSPQKLRERLQNEAKAISEAEASLQNELSKIGEEMAKLTASSHHSSGPRNANADLEKVNIAVRSLENKIPEIVKDMSSRNDAIKSDLEKSLQASEFKVKGLDQLYKESSAENELLYEKFNGELGKIVKALKGKNEKEELVNKLKEASEETAKTKKENARLRRELLTLRGLLKAHESGV
jgi:hypothetical protein